LLNFIRKFDPKTSIKNKILKTRSKNLTASLWKTWGVQNKKSWKTTGYKKAGSQALAKPRSTLWKSSIHAGSAHITCRKTVRMCSIWRRIHFRFLAHSLANARSLGLRRADGAFTPVGRFLTLLWGLVLVTRSVRQSTAVSCSHQPAVLPLSSGDEATRLVVVFPQAP
ncbi:hypothetical protein OCU84_24830, partial [Escherichia coli]|nr:hypothetical protein [Escherichia coli]